MLHCFDGSFSIITLLVICAVAFTLGYTILFWQFHRMMVVKRYPSLWGGGPVRMPLNWCLSFLFARQAGKAWFAERDHRILALIALVIATWGFLQATATGMSSYFGRSGSLIVMIGFISIFIGTIHANSLFETRRTANEPRALLEKALNAERAQGLSNRWVFGITAVGTLIWGYGDIIPGDAFFKSVQAFLTTHAFMPDRFFTACMLH